MSYIPARLRDATHSAANGRCEYCLLNEVYSERSHEVDHIIPEKHRGETIADNLCLSCADCNRYKGSNLCSIDPDTGQIVALYHPRTQEWAAHFQLDEDMTIQPLSANGRVTVLTLELNDSDRVKQRLSLSLLGLYPDLVIQQP